MRIVRIVIGLIVAIILYISGHNAPHLRIGARTYQDYGILDEEDVNQNIHYEPNWPNIFVGVACVELVIPPIYVFGYHLMKPVRQKSSVPDEMYEWRRVP